MINKKLENNSLFLQNIFFWVIGITSIRVFIEWALFVFPIQLNFYQDYIRFYLENIFYFLILFLALTLFVSMMTGLRLKGIMRFGVKLYPIIWLPPLIDHFFLGRTEGYYYATVKNFFMNFLSLYLLTEDGSLGLSLEVILGMAVLFVFVFSKTKSVLKSLLTAAFLHIFLIIFTTPEIFYGEWKADYYFDIFLPTYYFFPFILFLCATLWRYDRAKLIAICRNFRLARSLVFVLAVIVGVYARYILKGVVYLFNPMLACCSAFLLWQVAVFVNDIHDLEIDAISNRGRPLVKGEITVAECRFLTVLFSFFAISFAAVINIQTLCLALLFILLAHIYSAPPLRLRNNFGGNLIIACAILISFFMGILSSGDDSVNIIPLLPISMMMFIFTVVLTLAKDIKDIEGDKKAKVQNLFTLYGKHDAKKVISALIFLVLNIALVFYFHPGIVLISLLATYLYYQFENVIAVYFSGVTIIIILFYQLHKSMMVVI